MLNSQSTALPRISCLAGCIMLSAQPLHAAELWTNTSNTSRLSLNPSFKMSAMFARNQADKQISQADSGALALHTLRLDFNARFGPNLNAQCSYEHSGWWTSRSDFDASGKGILPSSGKIPYRMTQLYDRYVDKERATAAHELDRALLALHTEWGEITVGRQAIGLGRGRLFSAVDMFAPFSPLEIDREWRRGVDAIRAEYTFSTTAAAELIGVFGRHWNQSATLLRIRGYFGNSDAELLLGRRYKDKFLGIVLSSAVFKAEIHGECALFRTPEEHPHGESWCGNRYVPKAVLGSSYTFNVGNGLSLMGEYHYSGFGAGDTGDISTLYTIPEFRDRILRGDTQIQGRHAVGIQVSYPVNESLSTNANLFVSPYDGSGLFSPSLRWDFSRSGSLILAGYLPWGQESEAGMIRSEYGGMPRSLLVQLSFYM